MTCARDGPVVTFLAMRTDQDSAGLEILKPKLGVGVTSGHPLLAKTSYKEPDAGGVGQDEGPI